MLTIRAPAAPPPRAPPSPSAYNDIDPDPADEPSTSALVTPGEAITSDPQWMRGHGTYTHSTTGTITSSVLGRIVKTNKLLSVRSLSARYAPEIGDLVVGRITEVQAKRWKVDINSHSAAVLLLASINLPGGILRKRTSTDELQIRSFFAEGELVVAEVQSLYSDGSASLHTRSLKYGKLRNGYFVSVGEGGIQRSRTHVVSLSTTGGGGEVDVVLGVNGYVWIAQKTVLEQKKGEVSITRLEEEASEAIYSNKNDYIAPATRREIARIGNCIKAMVRYNVRVDEEMLNAVYGAAVDELDSTRDGVDETLEGEAGRMVVEKALANRMEY